MKRLTITSAAMALAFGIASGSTSAQTQSQAPTGTPSAGSPTGSGSSSATGQSDPSGQAGTAGQTSTTESMSRSNRGDDAKEFVKHMAIAGMTEVQLGQMAAARATNPEVKAFGEMMVKDHTQANSELTALAAQLNVPPPTELDRKHQDVANRLSKLQGAEFDREYLKVMVQSHQDVAKELQKQRGMQMTANSPHSGDTTTAGGAGSQSGTTASGAGTSASGSKGAVGTSGAGQGNQALTNWAAKTLPVVQQHLQHAQQLQQSAK
jgi:putative membrane protein